MHRLPLITNSFKEPSMSAKKLFLELSLPSEASEITKSVKLDDDYVHLEVEIQNKIYQSRPFKAIQADNPVLLRVELIGVSLPIKKDLPLLIKLFVHLPTTTVMLGSTHYELGIGRFPLETRLPITGKSNNSRIASLFLRLDHQEANIESIYKETYGIGHRISGQLTVFEEHFKKIGKENLAKQASNKNSAEYCQVLLQGVALAILSKAKKEFFYFQALKHTIDDEFSEELLSWNSKYMHSPDGTVRKNIFIDLNARRVVITKPSISNSIPRLHFSSMVQLPNGGYIQAGGVSNDNIVNYTGLYYFDPRTADYYKISEVPFNIQKNEMYYQNGHIIMFGGIDHKEEKNVASPQLGLLASTIHRFNLANRKWTKGEKMVTKFNDRCFSVYFQDQFIVSRGTDALEVFGKTAKTWKTVSVKEGTNLVALLTPSIMFVVNNELHVVYRKVKQDIFKFVLATLQVTEKQADLKVIAELELEHPSNAHVIRKFVDGTLHEFVYIFEKDGYRMLTFTKGVYEDTTEKLKFDIFIEQGLQVTGYGKAEENCMPMGNNPDFLPAERGISGIPSQWPEGGPTSLQALQAGICHTIVPDKTGKTLVLGYFENIKDTSIYKANLTPVLLRNGVWESPDFVSTSKQASDSTWHLKIPSINLTTVAHTVVRARMSYFVIGGLELLDHRQNFTAEEALSPKPIPGVLEPSTKIMYFKPHAQLWKTVALLPKGLYGCKAVYHDKKLTIIGGKDAAGEPVNKIWTFDIQTFSLVDHGATFDAGLTKDDHLEVFRVDKSIMIGAKGKSKIAVYSIKDHQVYSADSSLMEIACIYASDNSTIKYPDHSAPKQDAASNEKKEEAPKTEEIMEVKKKKHSQNATKEDSTKNLPRLVTLIYTLQSQPDKEYTKVVDEISFRSQLQSPKDQLESYLTTETKSVVELSKSYKEGTLHAAYKTKDDIFAIDELECNRNFSDFLVHPRFSVLQENQDGQYERSEYVYSLDTFTTPFDPKVTTQAGDEASNYSEKAVSLFTKGLVSLKFHKNAATCSLPHCKILLTGGEKPVNGKLISTNHSWLYDPISKTFSETSKMKRPRVYHTLLQIQNYVYCIGGRTGSSGQAIRECERYNITTGKWEDIGSLPVGLSRTSACSLFYRIYIVGGELENGQASDCVYIYNLRTDCFESHEGSSKTLKLEQPLKGHIGLAMNFNTILLAGGQKSSGEPNMAVYLLELNDGYGIGVSKVIGQSLYSHIDAKSFSLDGNIFFVGGNDINGTETYNLRSQHFSDVTCFRKGLKSTDFLISEVKAQFYITDSFLHNNPTFDKLYIFGVDQKKEIWRCNLETLEWDLLEVPDKLNLWNYSIAITLPDGRIFISGGIKFDLKMIKNEAYLLTPQENSMSVEVLPSMSSDRYTHTSVYLNNFVYCLGGRTYGENMDGIHNECERFNLKEGKWESIAKMNSRRCTASATSYKNHIYVMGGYQMGCRCGGIERYNEIRDEWTIVPLTMDIPIEATVLCHVSDSEIVLLGGKDQYTEQKYATVYDLESCTMVQKPQMAQKHVLGKGAKFLNSLLVISGSSTYAIEKCNVFDWKWEDCGQIRVMQSKEFSRTSYAQSY